jgi:hypothetical protein
MPRFVTIGGSTVGHLRFADNRPTEPLHTGNAFYSALGMRLWSEAPGSVGIVSSVGAGWPQAEIDRLAAAGLDVSGIRRRQSKREFEVKLEYDADGKRVYQPPPGLLSLLQRFAPGLMSAIAGPMWRSLCPQAEEIPPAFFAAEGAMVCAAEYGTQACIAQALHGWVPMVVLDPPTLVLAPHGTAPKGLADLSLPDWVLPSEDEIHEYFGDQTTPEEGVKRLEALGARNVAVKLGARGSMVFDPARGARQTVPVYPTTVVDATGAGDAYGGGFLVGLVETGDPVLAAMYGTISASYVIEDYRGDVALRATRVDAEGRLRELRARLAQWEAPGG